MLVSKTTPPLCGAAMVATMVASCGSLTWAIFPCLVQNLVDLAGSENARAASSSVRFKEGRFINCSLLELGNVISKLSEGKRSEYNKTQCEPDS